MRVFPRKFERGVGVFLSFLGLLGASSCKTRSFGSQPRMARQLSSPVFTKLNDRQARYVATVKMAQEDFRACAEGTGKSAVVMLKEQRSLCDFRIALESETKEFLLSQVSARIARLESIGFEEFSGTSKVPDSASQKFEAWKAQIKARLARLRDNVANGGDPYYFELWSIVDAYMFLLDTERNLALPAIGYDRFEKMISCNATQVCTPLLFKHDSLGSSKLIASVPYILPWPESRDPLYSFREMWVARALPVHTFQLMSSRNFVPRNYRSSLLAFLEHDVTHSSQVHARDLSNLAKKYPTIFTAQSPIGPTRNDPSTGLVKSALLERDVSKIQPQAEAFEKYVACQKEQAERRERALESFIEESKDASSEKTSEAFDRLLFFHVHERGERLIFGKDSPFMTRPADEVKAKWMATIESSKGLDGLAGFSDKKAYEDALELLISLSEREKSCE